MPYAIFAIMPPRCVYQVWQWTMSAVTGSATNARLRLNAPHACRKHHAEACSPACVSPVGRAGEDGGASAERLYPHSLSAHAIIGFAFVPPMTTNFAPHAGHGSGIGFCQILKSHFTVSSL